MTTTHNFKLLGHQFGATDFIVGGDNILTGDISGLLGENFLTYSDAEFDLADGVIRLFDSKDCGHTSLAYWAHAGDAVGEVPIDPSTSFHVIGRAEVNGHVIRVLFDTGAKTSILKLNAAAHAGLSPRTPGAVPGGAVGGLGLRRAESWIVPITEFAIGGEQINNTRIRIGAIELDDADMLLGADFFLSHRVYMTKKNGRLYFTYNGGHVFDLRVNPLEANAKNLTNAEPGPDAPKDAASFARLGAAKLSRHDDVQALADFNKAVELDADSPEFLVQRARAHFGLKQVAEARTDVDSALKLKPDYAPALLMRGDGRLRNHDLPGARADYDAAEAATPDDANLGLEIAGRYEEADQFELAVAEDGKWIAAHPDDDRMPDALDGRCWTYVLWNRELDKAKADCDRAVRLSRGDHSSFDSRALLRLRLGQYDAAIRDYDAALRLQPMSAWSHYGRGLAELRKGEVAAGQADIAAAQAIAPNLPKRAASLGLTP